MIYLIFCLMLYIYAFHKEPIAKFEFKGPVKYNTFVVNYNMSRIFIPAFNIFLPEIIIRLQPGSMRQFAFRVSYYGYSNSPFTDFSF